LGTGSITLLFMFYEEVRQYSPAGGRKSGWVVLIYMYKKPVWHRSAEVTLLCCFFAAAPVHAQNSDQEPAWYSPFFIEGALHYHFSPDPLSGVISPKLGFRGALGYEWQKLRFFASSGYSSSDGTDPLVTSFSFGPLTIGAGYALPIKEKWGAQADLGLGVQFLQVSHYETWLNLVGDSSLESVERKFFAEGRLYATYTPLKFLKIYAGGGADMVFEKDKPVFFPVLTAGVSLKPFLLPPPPPKPPKPQRLVSQPELEEEQPEAVVLVPEPEEEQPETVVLVPEPEEEQPEAVVLVPEPEEGDPEEIFEIENPPGQTLPFRYVVYFQPDRGTDIVDLYQPILKEVGERMQMYPETGLVLRGYAAPFDMEEGQITISAARVWYCTEYLKREYGIAEERIRMTFFGAGETSPPEGAGFNTRRRVEMFSEPLEAPERGEPLLASTGINAGGNADNWTTAFQYRVYFEADRGARIINSDLSQLRVVGRRLRDNPQMRVTLRGFATPSGTRGGQITRSAARVWFCVEFLKREYGIPEERIRMAFFGADEMTSAENADLNLRRRVEMVIENPPPERVQYVVFFEADSGTKILNRYLPQLREAGRRLRADARTYVTLRGYATPSGTEQGQIARSAARVWYCTEFLKKEFGIPEERIRIAFFGAAGMTEAENADWNLRRRVEIIVE
jgi:outer membrane protein OmpA-like peptidoglycan-associated protein